MELDDDKIDEAVLALLLLGRHDGARAWKGFDWEAMSRLHEKGFISDPRGKMGHPRGLFYLAFTEAWERFSY